MNAPTRVMSTWDNAPDQFYGDHWFGPTFLSLIDPSNARLMNTIEIVPETELPGGAHGVEIPFYANPYAYEVPHPDKDGRGRPVLLHLRDLTGEGIVGQSVLYKHVVSGIASGSVVGYSSKSDAAVQYRIESTQNRFSPIVKVWGEQLFREKPSRPGYWNFTWEPGHGAMEWIDEDVRFDPARQLFVERLTTRPYPGFAQFHCSVDSTSLSLFLEQIQKLTQDEREIVWLRDSIRKTEPNAVGSVAIVPDQTEELGVIFQPSPTGAVGIDLATASDFAAVLRAELKTWCDAN